MPNVLCVDSSCQTTVYKDERDVFLPPPTDLS